MAEHATRRATLALSAWLLLSACSPGEDNLDGPSLQRPLLRVEGHETGWPRAQVVASLDLSPLLDDEVGESPWQIIAPEHQAAEPADSEGAPVLWLMAPDDDTKLRLVHHAALDLTTFNEVRLQLIAQGPGEVSVELHRDGRSVGVGPRRQLVPSSELREVAISLPPGPADGSRADALSITFSGTVRKVGLAGIEWIQRPPEAWLPDPGSGPRLVAIAGDARRGVGLSTRRSLTTTVTVPHNGRLSFSYGQPVECMGRDADLQLLLEIDAQGGRIEQRFSFADRLPAWRSVDYDLSSLAGSEARIVFKLLAGDRQPTAAALTELSLWVPRRRPAGLLLVTSDTHRFDHLGSAVPQNIVSTPVLDALASRGVLFERCFSTTNVTNPSHMAMLTGVHPRDTGVYNNNLPLNDSAGTLAEVLAERGWLTHAVLGARHLGPPSSGLGQGFDRIDWPESAGTRDAEQSLAIVDQWLREAEDRPLFLWLHLFDAHSPYDPPQSFQRIYWPDDRDPFDPARPELGLPEIALPDSLRGLRDRAWPLAAYRGEVSWLDSNLADLLATPRFAENVIAVTADHGESFGQHGVWYTHAGLYPDSLHVPLILSWPAATNGRRVSTPVSQLDLAATLLELVGVDDHDLPGDSFAPLALAGTAPESPRFALSAHRFAASMTSGRWHLILHLLPQRQSSMTSTFAGHQVELYDLPADPGCLRDLSVEQHDQTARMRRRLIEWLMAADDKGWLGEELDDPERLAQLRELGYVAAPEATSSDLWKSDECDRCAPFLN